MAIQAAAAILAADEFFDSLKAGIDEFRSSLMNAVALFRPVEIELMPMCVMRSDRLTQFRHAHHRRILIVAFEHELRSFLPHIARPRIIGKALPKIDRIMIARELRHHLEYRDGQIGEYSAHAL